MMQQRGDNLTLDLLEDYQPAKIVRRYDEDRLRTSNLRARIARAVSETLRDCERSRDEIASEMSAWLGEDVTKNMLDAYASEAREDHTIPYLRLLALVHVTQDPRLLQVGAEPFGHVVIDARYMKWVTFGMKAEHRENVHKAADDVDREYETMLRELRRGAR